MPNPRARPAGVTARDYIRLGGPCLAHAWQFVGGANAGCGSDCSCSAPVHVCPWCGAYDYGNNEEADQVRARCAEIGPA